MGEPLIDEELLEIRERHQQACAELDRMTSAPGGPAASWRWSIPANPDRDSDLLLSGSVGDVPRLLAEVERLRQQVAAAEAVCARAEQAQFGTAAMVFTGRIRAVLS